MGVKSEVRENVTLSAATAAYLADLAAVGTHGSDVQEVIRTMVEEGVRTAVREKFLKVAPA